MRLDVTAELTFLDAERVDGSVAGVDDSVVGAGGHDGVVDREAGVFGNVQLPAELAHKRQAHGPDLEERGRGYSGPEERDRMENRMLGRMVPSELGSLTLNLVWKYGEENGENSPRSIPLPQNCVCVSYLVTRSLHHLVRGERERFVAQVCIQNLLEDVSAAHRTEERGQRASDWNHQRQTHKWTRK